MSRGALRRRHGPRPPPRVLINTRPAASNAAAIKALSLSGHHLNGGALAVTLDTGRAPRARREPGAAPAEPGAGRRRKAADEDDRAEPAPKAVNTVWVGGVAEGVDEATLRATFSQYGAIESVVQARGFAYIKYSSAAGMTAAIQSANGIELGGKAIAVEEATGTGTARPRRARRPARAVA